MRRVQINLYQNYHGVKLFFAVLEQGPTNSASIASVLMSSHMDLKVDVNILYRQMDSLKNEFSCVSSDFQLLKNSLNILYTQMVYL